jgi:transposase
MNNTTATISNERVDDLPLLINFIRQMGVGEIFDKHIPRHWLHKGLGWGWVAIIWLAHIISQGDHRKLTVRDWVRNAHDTLESITGLEIRDTDFTDDRLTILLRHLSDLHIWQKIETDLGSRAISVYNLKQKVVRVDATTVSGHHQVTENGLLQFGNSKDDPSLPQIKVMAATLDPLGLPLATLTVSGERADDPLYVPAIDRAMTTLTEIGLLFVGDCKMSALATRVHILRSENHYLTPLAMIGETATEMPKWIKQGLEEGKELIHVYGQKSDKDGKPCLLCKGYEFTRTCSADVEGSEFTWEERVMLACSVRHARSMKEALEKRIASAQSKLQALTPAPGRGKRQIRDEAQFVQAMESIIDKHKVRGLLDCQYERQVKSRVRYQGRGRGGKNRKQQGIEEVRYQVISVNRQEEAIDDLKSTLGWKAYVTSESKDNLSFEDAILSYRQEWRIERGFHRLKGSPLSLDPLFVQRDDQVKGLNYFMSIALRALTLVEFVVSRELKSNNEQLTGLHAENARKKTDSPTTERLLKAFSHITLTTGSVAGHKFRHVTPLSQLQTKILSLLGMKKSIYSQLEQNSA